MSNLVQPSALYIANILSQEYGIKIPCVPHFCFVSLYKEHKYMNRASVVSEVFLNQLVMSTSGPADNSEPEFPLCFKWPESLSPKDLDFDIVLTYPYIQCTCKGNRFHSDLETQKGTFCIVIWLANPGKWKICLKERVSSLLNKGCLCSRWISSLFLVNPVTSTPWLTVDGKTGSDYDGSSLFQLLDSQIYVRAENIQYVIGFSFYQSLVFIWPENSH